MRVTRPEQCRKKAGKFQKKNITKVNTIQLSKNNKRINFKWWMSCKLKKRPMKRRWNTPLKSRLNLLRKFHMQRGWKFKREKKSLAYYKK